MNADLKMVLERLSPLRTRAAKTPKCKICAADTTFFDVVDFNKHCSSDPYRFGLSGITVVYFRCSRCNFIFTEFIDDWSPDEIAKFIYNDDYVMVDPEYTGDRALRTAKEMSERLAGCEALRILDYGSGSGIFSREMTRNGFTHVESYDPYSSPAEPIGFFDLITCFEVIEHSSEPVSTLEKMVEKLTDKGAIIVGQSLQPKNIEELGAHWWYVGPRNGHVSIFAEETFISLATKLNLVYHRGNDIYAFTKGSVVDSIQSVVEKIGFPVHLESLVAPRESSSTSTWHAVEYADSRAFRWTAGDSVSWADIELRSRVTIIEIPFLMEIRGGFASQCIVLIDGKEIPTRVVGKRIVAEATSNKTRRCTVNLCTPPPLAPRELRGSSDGRRLGLAVAYR